MKKKEIEAYRLTELQTDRLKIGHNIEFWFKLEFGKTKFKIALMWGNAVATIKLHFYGLKNLRLYLKDLSVCAWARESYLSSREEKLLYNYICQHILYGDKCKYKPTTYMVVCLFIIWDKR